ncbi:MAG TPA: oligosaccharide flippase family protein, partial [Thermoplasmata archaeon]|nr:oligosaccharide flippase family protein [Thermoplasmata archaeon]
LGDSLRGQLPLLVESIVRSSALVAVALYLAGLPPASGTLGALADPANTMWVMTGAYAIGAIASAAVSLPAILRVRGPFHRPTATRMFRWSLPLMGSMVLLYLSGNLISILVVAFLNTRDFNIFNTANAFRILALSLPVAIAVPLFPHLSSLHQAEAFEVIRSRTWQSLRYTAILVVPVALSFGIYRSNLLNIFYQVTYVALASTPLGLLAASAIPAALSQIIGTSLTSVGRTRLELYITSVQVAALGGLCFALVGPLPPFDALVPYGVTGLNGAAIAVLASSLAALALNTYFLGTVLGVRIQLRPIGTILLAASASFFAVSRINEVLPINRYYQLAFGVLVGFLVYGAVLALTGELSKEDVDQVIRSLGLPRALGRFLASFCWRNASWPVNPMPSGGAEALVPGGGIDLGERSDGRVEPPRPPS